MEQRVIGVFTDSASDMIKEFNLGSRTEHDEEEEEGAPALAQLQVEEIITRGDSD